MSNADLTETCSPGDGGVEITARLTRDELVRGWRSIEAVEPTVVPVIRFGARTDLGQVRENNEDKFDFYEPEDAGLLAQRGSFYAVADGMGGHAAGQIASELALKSVIAHYYEGPEPDPAAALRAAVCDANERIHQVAAAIPDRAGMGTTLSAAVFVEDRVTVAQVGDSRAYLIRGGAIRQVTEDHSWVAEQVRLGAMTEADAAYSPYRNVITRSIGTGPEVEADIFQEQCIEGDIWVLCTDGLTGHVEAAEILAIATGAAPGEACRQLVNLAASRGGRDNITVIVLSVRAIAAGCAAVDAPPPPLPASAPAPTEPAPAKRGRLWPFGR